MIGAEKACLLSLDSELLLVTRCTEWKRKRKRGFLLLELGLNIGMR